MADDLLVEIKELEPYNEDVATPWQVKVDWCISEDDEGDPWSVRTWTVEVPSQLVAMTLKNAINNMTNQTYRELMESGYEK